MTESWDMLVSEIVREESAALATEKAKERKILAGLVQAEHVLHMSYQYATADLVHDAHDYLEGFFQGKAGQ